MVFEILVVIILAFEQLLFSILVFKTIKLIFLAPILVSKTPKSVLEIDFGVWTTKIGD